VSHSFHDESVLNGSSSIWFTVETLGDNETFSWQLARLDGSRLEEDG